MFRLLPLIAAVSLAAHAEEQFERTSSPAAPPGARHGQPEDAPEPRGIFLGEAWRYRPGGPWGWTKGLVTRSFADLLSIPSSFLNFTALEWTALTLSLAATVGMLIDVDGRSLDARLQDALHDARGVNCTHPPADSQVCPSGPTPGGFHLWSPVSNVIIVGVQVAVPVSLLLAGALGGHPELLESSTLAIEAWSVAQLYHVIIKLLSGREGVLWRTGAGTFHGPNATFFADGFPSGHAASLFALIGAYTTYFDEPWLYALLLGAGAGLAVGLVLDDYHYASETLFGAAMGFFIGRWVVRYRSSRFTWHPAGHPVRLEAVVPTVTASGGGAGVIFRF
ncbi:MAG: phosphatase PAP2 family protein [Myxococcota bacterium]